MQYISSCSTAAIAVPPVVTALYTPSTYVQPLSSTLTYPLQINMQMVQFIELLAK